MFLLTRPDEPRVLEFIAQQRDTPLSYQPVGLHARPAPAGFQRDVQRELLGAGEGLYTRACLALRAWRMFELGWVTLYPRGASTAVGTEVATVIRHLGFWSMQPTRVVLELPPSPRRSGFAYGTLEGHAARGEELFAVEIDAQARVWYEIVAVSRPAAPLARLGYPVARWLQGRFRRDSLRAMRAACRPGGRPAGAPDSPRRGASAWYGPTS